MKKTLVLLAFCILPAAGRVANQFSTTFVDVHVASVALDTDVPAVDRAGRGFLLMNGGTKPIRVQVEAEIPARNELREGARAIPDLSWVRLSPSLLTLAPQQNSDVGVVLHVPKSRSFRGKNYQVMLRASCLPEEGAKSIQIVRSLRVRLIFKTAKK